MERKQRTTTIEDFVRRRAGHVIVAYKNKLYMWGGYMEVPFEGTYNLMTQSFSHFHKSNEVWIYESLLNIWHKKVCTGDIPLQLSGACAGVINNYMYLFGGFHGESPHESCKNYLWRLDLETFTWKLLIPSGFSPFPCDKCASWVFLDRFYVFGGYGPSIPPHIKLPVQVAFETETETGVAFKGWIDQLAYYDAGLNEWVWPNTKGSKPSPRAAHAAAVLKTKAYVFGGRHKRLRLNDFYCLNLKTHTWNCVVPSDRSSTPPGRSWHTLTSISDSNLLLYGGFSTACQALSDAWLFDAQSMIWKELSSSKYQKRLWHCSATLKDSEVICVGGISNNLLDYTLTKEHAEDMLRIRFSPPTLFELALEYLTDNHKVTKKYWSQLTPVIQKILHVRSDPFEIHGI